MPFQIIAAQVHMMTRLLALSVLLTACSTQQPEAASGSGNPDTTATAGATPAPQPPDTAVQPAGGPEPNDQLLTPDGWGPLRVGMTLAEVVAAAGADANPDAVGGPDPATCDEFRPTEAPEGVLVMIERGRLTRVSVSRNRDIMTPAGLHVGDTGAAVEAAYGGSATVEPHQYQAAPARYITVWRDAESASPDERRGIRYEVDANDRVIHLRGGGPSIEYVEGCV